jgi:hypothetical protein
MDESTILINMIIALAQGGVGEFITEFIKETPWLKKRISGTWARLLSLLVIVALVGAYAWATGAGLLEAGTWGAVALASMRAFYKMNKGKVKAPEAAELIELETITADLSTVISDAMFAISQPRIKHPPEFAGSGGIATRREFNEHMKAAKAGLHDALQIVNEAQLPNNASLEDVAILSGDDITLAGSDNEQVNNEAPNASR